MRSRTAAGWDSIRFSKAKIEFFVISGLHFAGLGMGGHLFAIRILHNPLFREPL
jgi:hypothetical protein